MYIPSFNTFEDDREKIAFMMQNSFAMIVTNDAEFPSVSHLPFIIERRNEQLYLCGHFAKNNPHWKTVDKSGSVIVFTYPHAYISTTNYTNPLSVPTWNYIAVHAYGSGKIITDELEVQKHLSHLINIYEAEFKQKWESFSPDYQTNLMNGIVAFEIAVKEVQGKKKLSQNRKPEEREAIIKDLGGSEDQAARSIADWMKKQEEKKS